MVCRQIYDEAGLLAFSRIRFIVFVSSYINFDLEGKLSQLRVQQANTIRLIKLCFRPDAKAGLVSHYAPHLRHVLELFPGIESIFVENNVAHVIGRRARIAHAALILDFARCTQNNHSNQESVWRLQTTDSSNDYQLVNHRDGKSRTVQLSFVRRVCYLNMPWSNLLTNSVQTSAQEQNIGAT